jgi:hypothetical protein
MTIPDGLSFDADGWMSTASLRRPAAKKSTPEQHGAAGASSKG